MARAVMIHHMNVPIDDIAGARNFYGRILGLPEIKRPAVGRPGLWFGCPPNELHLSVRPGLEGGRTGLSLHPGDRPERREGHVAFTMEGSLDDIARHLEAEGIPHVRGTAGLPQIFCEDPAGNLVELYQSASRWAGATAVQRAILAARAKYLATQAAVMVTTRAVQVVGGRGVHRCYPLERLFRDVRTATMMPPNEDRAVEIIGKAMLGVRDDTLLARQAG